MYTRSSSRNRCRKAVMGPCVAALIAVTAGSAAALEYRGEDLGGRPDFKAFQADGAITANQLDACVEAKRPGDEGAAAVGRLLSEKNLPYEVQRWALFTYVDRVSGRDGRQLADALKRAEAWADENPGDPVNAKARCAIARTYAYCAPEGFDLSAQERLNAVNRILKPVAMQTPDPPTLDSVHFLVTYSELAEELGTHALFEAAARQAGQVDAIELEKQLLAQQEERRRLTALARTRLDEVAEIAAARLAQLEGPDGTAADEEALADALELKGDVEALQEGFTRMLGALTDSIERRRGEIDRISRDRAVEDTVEQILEDSAPGE
ncbi:MAG: hypothetical protein JXR94_16695 [Candidatus Hydrogenedentes bacterium]|nr:hypothetical protein [Candidatus Hydrogenedentota bacterium]